MTPDEQRHYARRRRAALAAGTWEGPVDAAPVVEHIASLRQQGMSVRAIATAAGLSEATVAPLAYPDTHSDARRRVSVYTARAILAVTPAQAPEWAWLPNVGVRRRIEALQWMGWPLSAIATELGVSVASISATKQQERVSVGKARRIDAVFRRLCMTPGPDRRTRTWAQKQGHVGPLAWDDIDDPDEAPTVGATEDDGAIDEIAVARAIASGGVKLTTAERLEVIRRMAAAGHSDPTIAEHCGCTHRTVERVRQVNGIASRWQRSVA